MCHVKSSDVRQAAKPVGQARTLICKLSTPAEMNRLGSRSYLPPNSKNKSDHCKVNRDITTVYRHIFPRTLLEQRDDDKLRDDPADACQQTGSNAPLPSRPRCCRGRMPDCTRLSKLDISESPNVFTGLDFASCSSVNPVSRCHAF